MIDYDYTLTKDLFSEIEIHHPHPELRGPLKNIIVVEGRNGKGKSLLMNIIAMSSFGYENRDVPASLRDDMSEYLRGKSTKLSFDLTISDPVTKRIIKANHGENDGTNIHVSESLDGGKSFNQLSVTQFNDRYNLIYDIPEDPRKRITKIISNAKYVQDEFKTKIGEAQKLVQNMLDDIKDHSVDKGKMKTYKDEIAEYERFAPQDTNELNSLKQKYETLIRYYHAKNLLALRENVKQSERDLKTVREQEESKESRPAQLKSAYNTKLSDVRMRLLGISNGITKIGAAIRGTGNDEIISLYNQLQTWDNETIIKNKKVDTEHYNIIRKIIEKLNDSKDESNTEEIRLLETLLNELEKFKGKNLKLEGFGTVEQLIKRFETQYDELNNNKKPSTDLNKLKSDLQTIKTNIESVSYKLVDLGDPPKIPSNAQYRDQDKIDRFELKLNNARSAQTSGYKDAEAYGISLDNAMSVVMKTDRSLVSRYDKLDIKNILSDANEIKSGYDNKKNRFDKYKKDIDGYKVKVNEWENQEESRYACHKAAINIISDQLYNINKKLEEMSKRFRAVENSSYEGFTEQDTLFPILWRYLGRRLKTVRYNDKEYSVKEVDAMNQLVVTETVKISMGSFSSGLNQRNYLLTKLSTEDKRPMIVLFDEIGIMDPTIQNDLIDRMIKLQAEGKLMAGMLNRPAEKLGVINHGL